MLIPHSHPASPLLSPAPAGFFDAGGSVRVVACPEPFSTRRVIRHLPAGLTMAEIVEAVAPDYAGCSVLHTFIGDQRVTVDLLRVRPKAGATVYLRAVPAGGRGKNPLATLLQLAVVAASIYLGPIVGTAILGGAKAAAASGSGFAVVSGLASTGISIVGSALVRAIAPPVSTSPAVAGLDIGSSPALQGFRNPISKFGAEPTILGEVQYAPPFAALPYQEIAGDDQYVRSLFLWGQARLALDNFRIGTTPLSAFQDINTSTFATPSVSSIYPGPVLEEPLTVALDEVGLWQERRSGNNAAELGIVITFPNGLAFISDEGIRREIEARFDIQYRPASGGNWQAAPSLSVRSNQTTTLRRHIRIDPPNIAGAYDVRIRRTVRHPEPRPDSTVIQDAVWSALQTYEPGQAITRNNRMATAVRVRATEQLNGTLDNFNGRVRSVVPVWTGAAWVEAPSSNPAYLFRWLLTGPANADPRPIEEVDDERLIEWAAYCDQQGFTYNKVIDYKVSIDDILAEIAAAGRAARSRRNNQWSVVVDEEVKESVQLFTPRNSWGFSYRKAFEAVPHALRVKYFDTSDENRPKERTVYRDGYNESNAVDIQSFSPPGITNADLAWRHGRYHLAALQLRPRELTFSTDWRHLTCHRGDVVDLAHRVVKVGLAYGRVKAVTVDGLGDVTAVTVDAPCFFEPGKTYSIAFETADLVQSAHDLVAAPGEQFTVTPQVPIPASRGIAAGDSFAFGESGLTTIEVIIREITKGANDSATLTCLDRSPAIHDADKGPIPPFDPGLTPTPGTQTPVIFGVQSDETVAVRMAGAVQVRMVVTFGFVASRSNLNVADVQLQLRELGGTTWRDAAFLTPETAQATLEGVEQGVRYQLRARYRYRDNSLGDWSAVVEHRVVGLSTPPPDVTSLLIEGDRAVWSYSPPIDFAGFDARFHIGSNRHWASATRLQTALLQMPELSLSALPSGTITLMVKAVDVANNESIHAAVALINTGDPITENVDETIDYGALGYPGAIVGGSVVGGEVRAAETTSMWSDDDAPMWSDDPTALMWSSSYLPMTYTAEFTPSQDQVANGSLVLVTTLSGEGVTLAYRLSGSAPAWLNDNAPMWSDGAAPMWSAAGDFVPWPGRLVKLTRQQYELRAGFRGGVARGTVSAFRAIVDLPDVLERLNDIPISSGGTRLPIDQAYRTIKNVSVTLQDQPGLSAVTARVGDKNADLGPLVLCFDAAGQAADGLIDAIVQGVAV